MVTHEVCLIPISVGGLLARYHPFAGGNRLSWGQVPRLVTAPQRSRTGVQVIGEDAIHVAGQGVDRPLAVLTEMFHDSYHSTMSIAVAIRSEADEARS
jgi:hypothetical protein